VVPTTPAVTLQFRNRKFRKSPSVWVPIFRPEHDDQTGVKKKRARGWGNHGPESGYRGVGLWGGEQPLKRSLLFGVMSSGITADE